MAVSTFLVAIESSSKQGTIKEHFISRKYNCAGKGVLTATSEMQCVHRCLRKEKCEVMNYRQREGESLNQDNCEVLDVPSTHESCTSTQQVRWKALLLTVRLSNSKSIFKDINCKNN